MQATLNAVESYRRARLVDGVTSDDDKPAPVYKLDEICDLLIDSTNDVVKEVADYVAQRLENSSPYVKQKALRLVKYALPRSTPQFRREIQRHSSIMKTLFHFKAPPDPLKGDAPSKAVREAAHEAVHGLFNPEPPQGRMARGGGSGGGGGGMEGRRMEGFGNTAPPRSGGSSGASGWGNTGSNSNQSGIGGMVGFGSDALQQGLSMLAGAAGTGARKPAASNFDSSADQRGAYRGPSIHETLGSGGGWRDSSGGRDYSEDHSSRDRDYSHYPREDGRQRDYVPQQYQGEEQQGSSAQYRQGVHSNGYSEQGRGEETPAAQAAQLVESVTTGGGVRVQPSREALQEFVGRAERLRGEDIAQALEWRLSDANWQVKMKSLCVLEAMLRRAENGASSVCTTVKSIFGDVPYAVEACLDSPQQSVRDKSRRVLDLLGASSGSTGPAPPASPTPQPDLIPDLLDASGSAPTASPSQAQAQGNLLDLLGGDSVSTALGSEAAMPASLSAGLGDTGSDAGGSLFEGLSVEDGAHAPSHADGRAPQQTPAPVPHDPFAASVAGLNQAQAPAQSGAAAVGDLLGEDVDNLFEGLKVSEGVGASVPAAKPTTAAGQAAKVDKSSILNAYSTPPPLIPAAPVPGMFPAATPMVGMPGAVPMGVGGATAWQQQQQMALAMQMQMQMQMLQRQGVPGGMPMVGVPGMPAFGVPGVGGAMPMAGGMRFTGGMGAGMGGGAGGVGPGAKGPQLDQFDFTGPPHLPTPGPPTTAAVKKEDAAAFDFVSGHLQAARSGKKSTLV